MASNAPLSRDDNGPAPGDDGGVQARRDRWLLMRLLAAGQSMPRLADRLMAERGSLGSVLATSDERLRQLGTDRNGIAMLGLLRESIRAVLDPRPDPARPPVKPDDLVAALTAEMAWLDVEEFRAAYLDSARRLIAIETMGRGSVSAAPVYPREIARRALELNAAQVILVHNHPSGNPAPSPADVAMTQRVANALAAIDMVLVDHLIVSRGGWARVPACYSGAPSNSPSRISPVGISTGAH